MALSGGVDSVCLLHAFKEQALKCGIVLSALHIEHGIRSKESERDMEFCRALCESWGVPLTILRTDVPALAQARGESVEQAGRAVRYEAFRSLLERGEADLVATAHHADDVAETIIFRLARGTGLSGMKAITEYGGIVRPLLKLTRAEIAAYAEENHLSHVEDSSNEDETYARNYIRRTVLPAFEKVHANAKEHLVRFAGLASEEDEFLERLAEATILRAAGEEWVPVDLPDVLFRRACLICMRRAAGGEYARANLEEIAKLKAAQSGKKVAMPLSKRGDVAARYAFREGKYIVFSSGCEGVLFAEVPFQPEAGAYPYPMNFSVRKLEAAAGKYPRKAGELYVDLDAFPSGCVVRTRRDGDMITPYHARRKTLKKFLTDRKIPARLGRGLAVIAKGSEVYVVVGVEIADGVKLTEKTRRAAVIG